MHGPVSWKNPLIVFHKMNFDGASKGNPRSVGFSALFRDDNGNMMQEHHQQSESGGQLSA